ncbi:MAG: alcohol dehydrogenase, class [Firmicutes bacterium]|nr:alcohol dehydrogenase, class [Bacillota bacterium]
MNINFFMPTKVIMSEECIIKNAELIKEYGVKALIVTGGNSAELSGALSDVITALQNQGISYDIYNRIHSNPSIASVYEGAAYAREIKAEFIIGIGGGSPMDASKAIALLAVQQLKEEELFSGQYGTQALPLILVPTTAGTGSEVTPYSILTNDAKQTKTSISSPLLFPKIAFLDARYTKSLPMSITINTALDALSHAIEGMLSVRSTFVSNALASESIYRITQCLRSLSPSKVLGVEHQLSIDIREKLLCGSMFAGVVIAHTGTTVVHAMGYCLTYFKDVDHGRANGLILPSFLRFIAKHDPEQVKRVLTAMGVASMDEFEALFLRLLGEREQITTKELERYVSIASQAKNRTNSKVVPTKEDIENIYTRSLTIV